MAGMDDAIGGVLANAVREAMKNNPVKPEDYEGLDEKGRKTLFCGVCHEPKGITVELFNGKMDRTVMRLMPVACECARKRYAEKRADESSWNRDTMRGEAGSLSLDCTFRDTEKTPEMDKCWKYIQKWDEMRDNNIGLLFWGGNGPGKSHAAHCIANELLNRDPPVNVYVKTFAAILAGKFDKSEVIERVHSAGLVVFEDLGAERGNDYAFETIFAIVDERYQTRKPTIVTTNLTWTEIQNPLDEQERPDRRRKRIYDRIVEMCVPIQFHGASRRGDINESKKAFVKNALGW